MTRLYARSCYWGLDPFQLQPHRVNNWSVLDVTNFKDGGQQGYFSWAFDVDTFPTRLPVRRAHPGCIPRGCRYRLKEEVQRGGINILITVYKIIHDCYF